MIDLTNINSVSGGGICNEPMTWENAQKLVPYCRGCYFIVLDPEGKLYEFQVSYGTPGELCDYVSSNACPPK